MASIESALLDMGGFERLAKRDSPIHRLDPRAKVITTLFFVVTVVSFGKYDLSGLMPLLLYPVVLTALANLPWRFVVGKLLLAAPFAVVIGLFNPLLDPAIIMRLGPVNISGGWISYASILIRFCLTMSAALVLIGVTGFNTICLAMARLKAPAALTTQCLLLYRYIFVLAGEAVRLRKAWSLRALHEKRMPMRVYGPLLGLWLVRAIDRAQRIHMAMLSRGFTGEIHRRQPLRFRTADALFMLGWTAFFVVVRCYNLPQLLGRLLTGGAL